MKIERQRTNSYGITLAEAKAACRIRHSDDDAWLLALVSAATSEIEDAASIAVIHQTVTLAVDAWPENGAIELPIGPLVSLTGITADEQAFTDFTESFGTLRLTTATPPEGEIVVTYMAGHGADSGGTPDDLRKAIGAQVLWAYDQHETERHQQALSPYALRVIGRYRRVAL